MSNPLPIRIHVGGKLALRDGLVFVLFVPASHGEIGAAVSRILEMYLALPGVRQPTLILDRGEEYRPCTPKAIGSLRRRLEKPSRNHFMVTLRDEAEEELPECWFQYCGDEAERMPTSNAYIEMWFPTEFPSHIGMDAFLRALIAMADEVPLGSGYCSIALHYEYWLNGDFIRETAFRYPGIDVRDTMAAASKLGNRLRGAYWLTLLGKPVIASLGKDASAIQAELGRDIKVHKMKNGVAIQAGEEPEAGDIKSSKALPLVREVARLVEPVLFHQSVAVLFDDPELCNKWLRRHLS